MRYSPSAHSDVYMNKNFAHQKKNQKFGNDEGWEFIHSQPVYWAVSDKPDGKRMIYHMMIEGVKCVRETLRMNNNPKAMNTYYIPGIGHVFQNESAVAAFIRVGRK